MHEFVLILFLYFAKSCLLSNWRKMSDEREMTGGWQYRWKGEGGVGCQEYQFCSSLRGLDVWEQWGRREQVHEHS